MYLSNHSSPCRSSAEIAVNGQLDSYGPTRPKQDFCKIVPQGVGNAQIPLHKVSTTAPHAATTHAGNPAVVTKHAATALPQEATRHR